MNELKEIEQKILKYLENRKTAATSKQIAKFFIRSESAVNSSLRVLSDKGLIKYIRAGGMKFYVINS